MNHWDWAVIVVYIAAVIGIAAALSRSQRTLTDYYLGSRTVTWWQSGASTMATQLGAISFVSAPAFVAIKEGGGLQWLCYELSVPLALIVVMAIIIPALHSRNVVSIYEYLEERFDDSTRSLVSILFQLGRGLATAVSVLAGGIILSSALSIPTAAAILLVGAATILYDVLGGIRVVILTDVLQMMIIIAGVVVCGVTALSQVGWETSWLALGPERMRILDFSHWGVSSAGTYSFWPMVLGSIFLYTSYYGCDQSQVQRELTVRTICDVRKSLLLNAIGRFPIVLLYCIMGVVIGAVITSAEAIPRISATLQSDESAVRALLEQDPDRMVPLFIVAYLPHGLIGFIFVAIMAALMSSLDSALNSLSAVTMRDIYQKYIKPAGSERHYLVVSKIFTLTWGIFCVGAALAFASSTEATRQTTIVLINAVGSLLYGPILAAFLLGMLVRGTTAPAVKTGIVAGIVANVLLWRLTAVSWLWWNAAGFFIAVAVALILSVLHSASVSFSYSASVDADKSIGWRAVYMALVVYFVLIAAICYLIQRGL
ncbi:MAG TPA: sodium/solute symporter [Thermodesulfobacteriota bacterium]|nr:sodium/solute symporter [Thermodesulfobacteriota bacterium]